MKYSIPKVVGLSFLASTLLVGGACYSDSVEAPQDNSPAVGEAPDATTDPSATGSLTGSETIAEVAANDASLSTFNTAIEAAGLTDALNEPGPYTVFAPSDEAFESLPPDTLEQLLLPENRDQLQQLLAYHVVPGELSAEQLQSGSVDTLAGSQLMVTVGSQAQDVTVNNAMVTQADLRASNGIVHVVDQVILPPAASLQR